MYDSGIGRLLGVLLAPGRTFESITRRPTWVAALVVMCVAVSVLGVAVHQRTDYRRLTEEALAQRDVDLEPAQLESSVELQQRIGGVAAAAGGAITAGVLAIIALLYMVGLRLAGSEIGFRHSFSVLLYAGVPMVLQALIAIPVVLAGGTLSLARLTHRDFLASNLAFLAPADAGPMAVAALTGLDFFALWSLVLSAIGYRLVGRVSPAVAWSLAIGIFLLGIGLRVGMAALASGGG